MKQVEFITYVKDFTEMVKETKVIEDNTSHEEIQKMFLKWLCEIHCSIWWYIE